jgi:hypothetical protein
MDLSDSRRAATRCGVRGGEPRPIGPPPITRIALPACCAHYPGGPERVRLPASFPVPHGLPRYPDGSASTSLLSRPAQASTCYGPLARSAAQGGLCHRASVRSLADRLSATRSNRLLSRWNLPPLATRAYGAHWAKALARPLNMATPLVRRAHACLRHLLRLVTHGHGARELTS